MNAAFLIMSSAALAGADPAPPPPPPAAPVVVSGGCNNCAPAPCESCKPSLLDKIKSRFSGSGKKSHHCGCAPAPAPCAPACAPAPAPCAPAPCDACAGSIADRPNLFDKMKSRWGSKKHGHGPCCDPCGATTGGCAAALPAGAPPVGAPGGTIPPKEMPKPKEKEKGGNTSSIPAPFNPVPAGLTGGSSPY